ncbi:hypothetical protein [Rhizobium sp. NXC24]|uniref:hypothetical protein n=1 Tax=Rhizobium sp. NXC24 TaxID=2048897 RepID=UPI000CDF4A36|nr:hypothetical protein [Rhizobium sp. NXC24]AVA22488.1 hypothetical protein NXC24_CH02859 [Rhizobium sp. NXC24]
MKQVLKSNRDGSEQILIGKVIWKEKPARKRDRRVEWKFSIEVMRLREIERVIRHRHNRGIPDPAGTDDYDSCVAYIYAVATTPRSQSVVDWCKTWAPWISDDELLDLVCTVGRRKYMLGAEATAKLLHVTMKERNALGLKTIGACDLSSEDRKAVAKELKRERDRSRQERKRREQGMLNRSSQEATTLAATKPWEAEGISRRTWFYRQKRPCTEVSRVEVHTNGDTPVQTIIASVPNPQMKIGQSRAAGLVAGLGDHPPAGFQGAGPHGSGEKMEGEAA